MKTSSHVTVSHAVIFIVFSFLTTGALLSSLVFFMLLIPLPEHRILRVLWIILVLGVTFGIYHHRGKYISFLKDVNKQWPNRMKIIARICGLIAASLGGIICFLFVPILDAIDNTNLLSLRTDLISCRTENHVLSNNSLQIIKQYDDYLNKLSDFDVSSTHKLPHFDPPAGEIKRNEKLLSQDEVRSKSDEELQKKLSSIGYTQQMFLLRHLVKVLVLAATALTVINAILSLFSEFTHKQEYLSLSVSNLAENTSIGVKA